MLQTWTWLKWSRPLISNSTWSEERAIKEMTQTQQELSLYFTKLDRNLHSTIWKNFFPSFPWFRRYLTMAVCCWHGQYSCFGNISSQHNFHRDLGIPQSIFRIFFCKITIREEPIPLCQLEVPSNKGKI